MYKTQYNFYNTENTFLHKVILFANPGLQFLKTSSPRSKNSFLGQFVQTNPNPSDNQWPLTMLSVPKA